MVKSTAATVENYLDELPADRRAVMSAVREVIRRHLPQGYREAMGWGGITYEIPLERFGDTYNGHPLSIVALAAQKNYFSLYLLGVYGSEKQQAWLKKEFDKAGKKLDMGKSCVRFKKIEDLPLDVIGEAVASVTPEQLIEMHESSGRKK